MCTSSNAGKVMEWAFQQGRRVLFLPDQHLGRNTGLKLGYAPDDMLVWNPFRPLGGHSAEALEASRIILWKGHCSVHTRFTPAQVAKAKAAYPEVNILVHPECPMETVELADYVGSTELIAKTIGEAAAGSVWGVGTEINLVSRLGAREPGQDGVLPGPGGVPVLDDVPHPPGVPAVGDGRAAGGAGPEPGRPSRKRRRTTPRWRSTGC